MQVVLHPTPNSPKQSELHKMTVTKACPDQDLKIKLAIRMDKPQNMKHCGWDTRSCFPSIFHPLAYRNPALSALVASFLVLYVEKYCQVYCAPWWMYMCVCVCAHTHICTRCVMYQNNYTINDLLNSKPKPMLIIFFVSLLFPGISGLLGRMFGSAGRNVSSSSCK